jgi:hypothetical protein
LPKIPAPRPVQQQKTATGWRGGWVAILVAFAAVRACSTFERSSSSRVQYPSTPAPALRQYSQPGQRALYSPGSEPPETTSERFPELKYATPAVAASHKDRPNSPTLADDATDAAAAAPVPSAAAARP